MQRYLTAQEVQKTLLSAVMTSDEAEARKLADANRLLADNFRHLGMTVPTTTAGFRDLIDGLDLTTKSGQDTLMAMAGTKDAFLLVAEAAKKADEQQREWSDKLAVLQGTTTEQRLAREKELAGIMDVATKAIAQQVYALQDQAAAAEKAAAALQKHNSVISGALDAYGGMLTASGDENLCALLWTWLGNRSIPSKALSAPWGMASRGCAARRWVRRCPVWPGRNSSMMRWQRC